MTMNRFLVAIIGLAMSAGPAAAQQIGSIKQGSEMANGICAECHAVNKGDPKSPNGHAPTFQSLANTRGISAMALRVALQTSHMRMPNIVLKQDERESVIAYILSLK
jgi:mono/diheme cytochrome c family protein